MFYGFTFSEEKQATELCQVKFVNKSISELYSHAKTKKIYLQSKIFVCFVFLDVKISTILRSLTTKTPEGTVSLIVTVFHHYNGFHVLNVANLT